MTHTKESIVDGHELTFDPGDKLNGSLYLGEPRNAHAAFDRSGLIAEMRAAGLWSGQPERQVPDAHRQAYKDQMSLVEVIAYRADGGEFLAARFDHPKFPSSAERWNEWTRFLGARFERSPV